MTKVVNEVRVRAAEPPSAPALEVQKADPRGLGVMKDPGRASWIDHLLTVLRDPAADR